MSYNRALGTLCVVTLTALSVPATASPPPRTQLEEFFRQATALIVDATDLAQVKDAMRARARALFDGRRAAARALGARWADLTRPERDEFVRMFSDVLERTYLNLVQARLPRDRPPSIRVVAEDIPDERTAIVSTLVGARDGSDVRIDYVMGRIGKAWLVHDVVIEGISLVENYRAQIAHVLRRASYDELVSRLWDVTGADPAASPATEARPGDVVTYFQTHRVALGPVSPELESVAAWLLTHPGAGVVVEGHTDRRGDATLNDELAERRANAVRGYFVARGVDADRVTVAVHGDRRPVCREPVESCWERNRRAVVRLTP
jgi:phospholipid transport system substrate-binding protein